MTFSKTDWLIFVSCFPSIDSSTIKRGKYEVGLSLSDSVSVYDCSDDFVEAINKI